MKRDHIKIVVLLLAVAAFLFFRSGIYLHLARAPQANAKPTPFKAGKVRQGNGPGIPGSDPSIPSPNMALAGRAGRWQGQSMIAGRGNCTFKLDMIQSEPNINAFEAQTSLACAPILAEQAGKPAPEVMGLILGGLSPTSAGFTGAIVGNEFEFKPDMIVDAAGDGCVMREMKISPFGRGKVAAGWNDSPCKGGQMILTRTP
jgi:hypothetical protein